MDAGERKDCCKTESHLTLHRRGRLIQRLDARSDGRNRTSDAAPGRDGHTPCPQPHTTGVLAFPFKDWSVSLRTGLPLLPCIFLYFFTKLYLCWVKAHPMNNYLRDKL